MAARSSRTGCGYLAMAAVAQWSWTGDTGAVPYDPTIYLGSAAHYRYGRPAYSPELEAVLSWSPAVRWHSSFTR